MTGSGNRYCGILPKAGSAEADVAMDKREFLKTSGILLAGTVLSPLGSGEQAPAKRTNWSGNYTFSTDRLHQPKTVEEVQQVVKGCSKLRALGARHSFNGIADSTQDQISLGHLTRSFSIASPAPSPWVGVSPTVNWPPISRARVMHCTIWPVAADFRCRCDCYGDPRFR